MRRVTSALLVFAYCIARNVVELSTREIEALSRFNVGQYRHAIDVTFASAAVAAVLASAIVPPVPAQAAILHRMDRTEWLWITVILVDICFGGLFTGRNAAAFWWTCVCRKLDSAILMVKAAKDRS